MKNTLAFSSIINILIDNKRTPIYSIFLSLTCLFGLNLGIDFYSGNLKQNITEMDFTSDSMDMTNAQRFHAHFQYLKNLKKRQPDYPVRYHGFHLLQNI